MKTYMTINPTSGALKHLILGLAATAAFLTTGAMPAHGQLINPHSPALRTALQPLMRTNREKQFPKFNLTQIGKTNTLGSLAGLRPEPSLYP